MVTRAFFIVGPPGSGKQGAVDVATREGCVAICTKPLLQDYMKKCDPGTASAIAATMSGPGLAEDDLVISLVEQKLFELDGTSRPVIIDTVRSPNQVERFCDTLLYTFKSPVSCIHLETNAQVSLNRIAGRKAEGAQTGHIREEDQEEVARERIERYNQYGTTVLKKLHEYMEVQTIKTDHLTKVQVTERVRRTITFELENTQQLFFVGRPANSMKPVLA
jgi:adenylate kinase family enzyme